MARASMTNLITRTRELINDTDEEAPIWTDDQIQNVLDAGRADYRYLRLLPTPTYDSGTVRYLDYYAPIGDWETDYTFSQWFTTAVTPATFEPIAGHFVFAESTLPPVYICGKSYDLYRAAADLLERQAAQYVLAYNVTANGQTLQRSQIGQAMRDLAKQYRMQQRPRTARLTRPDLANGGTTKASLRPIPQDYGV